MHVPTQELPGRRDTLISLAASSLFFIFAVLRFGPFEHMPYYAELAAHFWFGGEVRVSVIGSGAQSVPSSQ